MRTSLFLTLLLTASFSGFIGYCFALMGWLHDLRTSVYEQAYLVAGVETATLGGYTYLAPRFLCSKQIH